MVNESIEQAIDGVLTKLANKENSGSVELGLHSEGKFFKMSFCLEHGRVWALSELDRTKMKLGDVNSYLNSINASQ